MMADDVPMSPLDNSRTPEPSWLTRPFWDAAAIGRLVVQRCSHCGEFIFRPEAACTACLSEDLVWVKSRGTGRVHSFTVVNEGSPGEYVLAVVAIEEGWHIHANRGLREFFHED
jgi:uncharacterized protein